MSLSILSTIDPALSGSDKIKAILGANKLDLAAADGKNQGGNGDGFITADELSNMVRGNVSVLDLDSIGGMDGLNAAIKDFSALNHVDDAHSVYIPPTSDAAAPAATDAKDAATPAADDPLAALTKEIADLKDEIKGLKVDLAKKEVDDLKAEVDGLKDKLEKPADEDKPHHHHRHHHHHHGIFGLWGMLSGDPLGLLA